MTGRIALRLAFLAALLLFPAPTLRAQCSFPGATHVTWPAVNPVWDFCFRRPSQSAGANGSGLELSEVRYKGTLVIFQAHIPILNIKYVPNALGCGGQNLCYRDWFFSEQPFQCSPSTAPGYCTGTAIPASTVCQHPGMDAGTFTGVAVEDFGTSLRLTSQCEAGWYRYIPVWEFFADGTIQARFVATSIDHSCVAYTHIHHAYFRLDLDLNGNAGNSVDEVLCDGSTARVTTERNFIDSSPARSKWRVTAASSPFAVEISRNLGDGGAGDPLPVPDDFPVADGWVLAYDQNEIVDYPDTSTACAANVNSWDNNQSVDGADIVMWVRAAALHQGEPEGEAADCSMVGPTIRVVPFPPSAAMKLNTVFPCRIVDTRNAPGPYGGPALQANATRTFLLAGQCGVPASARSVAVNLTITQPSSGGHLSAFPSCASVPLASTLNFSAGQTRANNAVLPLGTGGAISINSAFPSGTAHFILDVTGWFE